MINSHEMIADTVQYYEWKGKKYDKVVLEVGQSKNRKWGGTVCDITYHNGGLCGGLFGSWCDQETKKQAKEQSIKRLLNYLPRYFPDEAEQHAIVTHFKNLFEEEEQLSLF
jgi:hypothetical protein